MIYFIRHGQSTSNCGGITRNMKDINLSEEGKKQAEGLVEKINKKPDLIVLSPYIRTHETAAPLMQKYPTVHTEIWPVQEFTFLGHASYDNTTQDQRRGFALEYIQKDDPACVLEDGSESFNGFIKRVDDAIKKLKEIDKNKFVVVFSHDRFIRAIIMRKKNLDITIKSLLKFREIQNAEIVEL